MKTTDFLDAVRARHRLPSDYRLAKFPGVPPTTISGYRLGRSLMHAAVGLKIAAAADLGPGDVLVAIAIEREKRVEVKTAWQRVAKRLAGTVALVLIGASLHNPFRGAMASVAGPIYTYATIWARRLARWTAAALSRLLLALGTTLALAGPAAAGADWSRGDLAREITYQAALTV